MITESYDDAFDTVYYSFIPIDLKINEKIVLFRPETNGFSIILPRKRIVTAHQIKGIIEKYNPSMHYSLKLDPSELVLNYDDDVLVRFKKRSFYVNFYGIFAPEKTYEFYKELTKDIIKIYDPRIRI